MSIIISSSESAAKGKRCAPLSLPSESAPPLRRRSKPLLPRRPQPHHHRLPPPPTATTPEKLTPPAPARAPTPPRLSPAPSPEKLDWGDIEDDNDDKEDNACDCDEGTNHTGHGLVEGEVATQRGFPALAPRAASTATSNLGSGHDCAFLAKASSMGNLGSDAGPSEAPPKLKSVVVAPPGNQSPARLHQSKPDRKRTPAARLDPSPPWEEVKSKCRMQGNSFPSSSAHTRWPHAGEKTWPLPLAYKEAFRGKCFRCLASDHKLAQCQDPRRCLFCRGIGHFVRHCPQRTRHTIRSRLTFPSSSIHSRITFPSPDIHNRLEFPPLPTLLSQSPVRHPALWTHTPDAPSQHPALAAEFRRLRCTAIVLTCIDGDFIPEPEELKSALS
jgi:hypothetical protein